MIIFFVKVFNGCSRHGVGDRHYASAKSRARYSGARRFSRHSLAWFQRYRVFYRIVCFTLCLWSVFNAIAFKNWPLGLRDVEECGSIGFSKVRL